MRFAVCSPCRSFASKQRGLSMVVVLMVVALVTAMTVALADQFDLTQRRVGNSLHSAQGMQYLRGAEALARHGLLLDQQHSDTDHLGEQWAQPQPPFDVKGGWVAVALRDAQGRLNLNSLLAKAGNNSSAKGEAKRFTEFQRRFIRLLQCFDEPALSEPEAIAIAEAVIDWLDADDNPTGFGGAESLAYQAHGYRPANRLMASVSELRLVKGMTPELYRQLRPHLTVLPTGAGLNVNTASAELLRSISQVNQLSPLPPSDAQQLMEARGEQGFADLERFLSQPVMVEQAQQGQLSSDGLSVSSNYFVLDAGTEILERRSYSHSVLQRGKGNVQVIRRRLGKN